LPIKGLIPAANKLNNTLFGVNPTLRTVFATLPATLPALVLAFLAPIRSSL
jgi:hypothetical protein